MKKYLLIYHKEDNDGVFSAAIFYNHLIHDLKVDKTNIQLLGADYNMLSEFANNHHDFEYLHDLYDTIIMTDISFNNPDYMNGLYKEFGSNFIWCDHHKPIIDASYILEFNNCPGIRNSQKSAILCVYEFLYDTFNEVYSTIDKHADPRFPELFRVLSGWDSWSYEREGYSFDYVRNVNKGVTNVLKLDFEKIVNKVYHTLYIYHKPNKEGFDWGLAQEIDYINKMHNIGKSLNEYDDNVMADIIRNSGDCSWQVWDWDKESPAHPIIHKACAIFHQGATNSTMFKSLKKTDIKHGLVFKHNKNGNWVLSMYNVNDEEKFHCGEFLKERYNGGGHKGAAGCTLTQEQFINILEKKRI